MKAAQEDRFLTLPEAAELLKLTTRQVREESKAGRLFIVSRGPRRKVITASECHRYIAAEVERAKRIEAERQAKTHQRALRLVNGG